MSSPFRRSLLLLRGGETVRRKFTLAALRRKYSQDAIPSSSSSSDTPHSLLQQIPVTMVTAYGLPSARAADIAGVDVVLVGDSVGMVELGHATTLPVTLSEMLHHCRAVSRSISRPLLVGDLPFGSYHTSPEQAVDAAVSLVKEGGMDAVKLEGGVCRTGSVRRVAEAGVAVMGHVGLTPQAQSLHLVFLTPSVAEHIGDGWLCRSGIECSLCRGNMDAVALQEAGVFAIVLECIPSRVAAEITRRLRVPTIGIGAGSSTSGQVLVFHDLCGMCAGPQHERARLKYASVGEAMVKAVRTYCMEVSNRSFPTGQYAPYKIGDAEMAKAITEIDRGGARIEGTN